MPTRGISPRWAPSDIDYVDSLERGIAKVAAGQDHYERGLLADSVRLGRRQPPLWRRGPLQRRALDQSGAVREAQRGAALQRGGRAGQIQHRGHGIPCARGTRQTRSPERAVDEGLIDRFGSLNPTDGIDRSRYSLSSEWQHTSGTSVTKVNAYVIESSLDLFSDFTYFLNDPVHGDQFEQTTGASQSR